MVRLYLTCRLFFLGSLTLWTGCGLPASTNQRTKEPSHPQASQLSSKVGFDQLFAETSQQIQKTKKQTELVAKPSPPATLPSRSEREHRELQRSVISLRKRGLSYDEISQELSVAPEECYYASVAYLRRVAGEYEELSDMLRVLEGERLDDMLQGIYDKATEEGDLEAVRTVLKIMDRRAKLQGLDAPKRITADVRRADIRLQVAQIRHSLEEMGDNDLEDRYRAALEAAGCSGE